MMEIPYLELVLGFILVVYVLDLYIDFRQLKALNQPKPPPELAEILDKTEYQKTQAYSLDKWWFGFWHSTFGTLETLTILSFKLLPVMWFYCGAILDYYGYRTEILQTVVFAIISMLFSQLIQIPWNLYFTFVIEERHGFNKQTLGLFFSDILKGLLLMLVLVPPLVSAITWILQLGGPLLPFYLWGFLFTFSLIMMTLYPNFIAPLFNKFEALEEGSLRTAIEALAGSLKFPLKKLYKMDGSRRSGHSNAYMYGFFKNKRIVLYDTLISQCSEEEVVAVLAHELGHWKLRHTPILFTVGQVVMLSQFMAFAAMRGNVDLYNSFGFVTERPVLIALVLFQFISSPLDEVLSLLQNVVSRIFEFQADGFAVGLGHAVQLKAALLALEKTNRSAPHVDPLYSAFHYSHPPLVERLKAIDRGLKSKKE